jgi:predicted PurR-regulated permease PerM
VYTFFLLFYRTKTAHFIFRLTGRKNKRKTLDILRQVSTITTKYMSGLLIVVLILAVLNTAGLFIIGVRHALLFGILAALLNLIPYIGTFIGGLIPIVYVLLTSSSPFQVALQIFILFSVVQFLENNLITPNVVGNNIKINPLAIILSLLLGNMIWGIPGMLIVIPCLAILKIIMQNIEDLRPFAYLISDRGVANHEMPFRKLWKRIRITKPK